MSNISKDKKIETMPDLMSFFEDRLKDRLYTSIPAIIQSFDAAKRRATIILAIQREITDGTTRDIQQLLDVPVIFPSASGFSIFMPLKKGDSVVALFSQRGIENFKQNYKISLSSNNSVLSIDSAVVIAGFGQLDITPSDNNSASMQTTNGKNAVVIGNNEVSLRLDNNSVKVSGSDIKLSVGEATATLTSSLFSSSVPIAAPDFTSNTGDEATFSQGIITPENVVAGTISLRTHVHPDPQGGNTGAPIS